MNALVRGTTSGAKPVEFAELIIAIVNGVAHEHANLTNTPPVRIQRGKSSRINAMFQMAFENGDSNGSSAIAVYQLIYLLLTLFVTLLFLPQLIGSIVEERASNCFYMMRMSGLQPSAYWTSFALFYSILYITYTMIFVIIGSMLGAPMFAGGGALFVAVFICWGYAQVGVAIFLSSMLATKRAAVLAGYIVMTATAIIAFLLEKFTGFQVSRAQPQLHRFVCFLQLKCLNRPSSVSVSLHFINCCSTTPHRVLTKKPSLTH
jgi:hypothetical protein